MAKVVDYYFTLNSPWTYLGSARLERMAAAQGAEIRVKPAKMAVIFPQTGGLPLPKRAPARQAYRLVELARWRDHLGMPLNLEPAFFPADETLGVGLVIAAGEAGGDALKLAHAILRAVWAEERNMADEATLAAILEEWGFDAGLMERARAPEVAAKHDTFTEEALAAGVFGAPSYVLEGELFWGQDRLDFLERALARS